MKPSLTVRLLTLRGALRPGDHHEAGQRLVHKVWSELPTLGASVVVRSVRVRATARGFESGTAADRLAERIRKALGGAS